MSPELLDPDRFGSGRGRPTKESDCYALGMVILEVLSGQAPFTTLKNFVVMRKVTDGERPGRPDGVEGVWFTDDLWRTLNQCWETQPGRRPSIETVLECLGRASPPSPGTADGAEKGINDGPGSTASDSCMFHHFIYGIKCLQFSLHNRPNDRERWRPISSSVAKSFSQCDRSNDDSWWRRLVLP